MKSDNSLNPPHGCSDSDSWEDIVATSSANPLKPSGLSAADPPKPASLAGSRSAEPASTSGRQLPGSHHQPSRSSGADSASAGSQPSAPAHWQSKTSFVGRPLARVSNHIRCEDIGVSPMFPSLMTTLLQHIQTGTCANPPFSPRPYYEECRSPRCSAER